MPTNPIRLDDPMLQEASKLIRRLSVRGITVFHNPTYGIMLMGARPDSPQPAKEDMDEAYALHNEIAILFAVQSVAKVAQSMSVGNGLLDRLGIKVPAEKEG